MDISLIERLEAPGTGRFPATTDVRVLYEDEGVLAVDKPAGMVVHPAYRHPTGTLADAVFARQAARGEGRPWLLHRLDRDTTGVVLFAKTEPARRALVRQFERRTVKKLYLALASRAPSPDGGIIDAPLARDLADRRRVVVNGAGQSAITRYAIVEVRDRRALLLVRPVTGRTHQIRAHLAHLGAALVGDTTYLPADDLPIGEAPRALLHAWRVEMLRPGAGTPLAVSAPLAPDFAEVLARLGFRPPSENCLVACSHLL